MRLAIPWILLLWCLVPATATAAADPRGLDLAEAARLTLELDPAIASARAEVRLQQGVLEETRGDFDTSLALEASYDYRRTELTSAVLASEETKRESLRILTEQFNSVADDLERQLMESDGRAFADCGDAEIFVDGEPVCSTETDRAAAERLEDLLAFINLDPEIIQLIEQLDDELIAVSRGITQDTIDVFRATAAGTQNSLDLLGEIPELEEVSTLSLDLQMPMPFRNGMVFTPSVLLEGVEDNYVGKEKLSSLGGKGLPNTYTTQVRLTLSMPVQRGFGRRFTTAPERAAELELRAAEADVRHLASQRVLAALEAFWSLVAAQERQRLLEASTAAQEQLSTVSGALAEADLIPRSDLSRSAAELASAESLLAAARRALAAARLSLARTLGLDVERLADAPAASGSFPAATAAPGTSWARWLIEESVIRRHDLAAARFRRQASGILRDAAEQSLKTRIDLDLAVGYLGLEQRASVGQGFFGALTRDVPGLSAVFGLSFDWPTRNRVAQGQLSQAAALRRQRDIAEREIERRIRTEVADVAGRLDDTLTELARREQTARLYEETHLASVELFQAGEGTLLATLLTEQRLTSARLALLAARQSWATLLARLRFGSGSLLSFIDGEPRIVADLTSLPTAGGD
ncbi:MAG: TolC family protein [Acidobacteriota bacterium]